MQGITRGRPLPLRVARYAHPPQQRSTEYPMRAKRTIRKPTRWPPDEWRSVEDAARARRLPPLRFVREAVLGAVQTGATVAASRGTCGDPLHRY